MSMTTRRRPATFGRTPDPSSRRVLKVALYSLVGYLGVLGTRASVSSVLSGSDSFAGLGLATLTVVVLAPLAGLLAPVVAGFHYRRWKPSKSDARLFWAGAAVVAAGTSATYLLLDLSSSLTTLLAGATALVLLRTTLIEGRHHPRRNRKRIASLTHENRQLANKGDCLMIGDTKGTALPDGSPQRPTKDALRTRLRRPRSWALLLTAFAVAACTGATDPSPPVPDQPSEGEAPIVDWSDPEEVVRLDDWTILACEGDAPLLCVERNGTPVGFIEASAYPVESLDWFDPSSGSDENLAALAEEFLGVFEADRADGCGGDYVFEALEPEPFVIANTPGIFFGFSGTMPDGRPSELNLQYATVVKDRILSVVAIAYDDGGCPGRDELSGFSTAQLTEFRPHLESILHESPLPQFEG